MEAKAEVRPSRKWERIESLIEDRPLTVWSSQAEPVTLPGRSGCFFIQPRSDGTHALKTEFWLSSANDTVVRDVDYDSADYKFRDQLYTTLVKRSFTLY